MPKKVQQIKSNYINCKKRKRVSVKLIFISTLALCLVHSIYIGQQCRLYQHSSLCTCAIVKGICLWCGTIRSLHNAQKTQISVSYHFEMSVIVFCLSRSLIMHTSLLGYPCMHLSNSVTYKFFGKIPLTIRRRYTNWWLLLPNFKFKG